MLTQKRLIASCLLLLLSLSMAWPAITLAYDPTASNYGLTEIRDIKVGQSDDLKEIIVNIINIALGFLGVLAVIFIIYGGFLWMTAAGNEEQVGKARKMIVQAVVGLAVIFAAYIIANFVISQLREATDVRT